MFAIVDTREGPEATYILSRTKAFYLKENYDGFYQVHKRNGVYSHLTMFVQSGLFFNGAVKVKSVEPLQYGIFAFFLGEKRLLELDVLQRVWECLPSV